MYGPLSMYLKSTDPARVEEVVQRIAAVFRQRDGFRSCTTSVDALMGPRAKSGEFARVVVVDFDTLEDALGALQSEAFGDVRTASEQLGPTHYLFECREV
jgi:phenylalanyl-tRNA synthetase beta subunit